MGFTLMAAEDTTNLITKALENVTTVFNSGVDMVTGNSVAMVFIGFSLAGVGVAFFKRLTRKKG